MDTGPKMRAIFLELRHVTRAIRHLSATFEHCDLVDRARSTGGSRPPLRISTGIFRTADWLPRLRLFSWIHSGLLNHSASDRFRWAYPRFFGPNRIGNRCVTGPWTWRPASAVGRCERTFGVLFCGLVHGHRGMAERISHERKSGQSLIGLFSDHFDRHQFRSTVDQLGADLSSTTHSRRDTAFAGYSAHWSDSNTCTSAAPSGFFQV